jgi:hypothetical protein
LSGFLFWATRSFPSQKLVLGEQFQTIGQRKYWKWLGSCIRVGQTVGMGKEAHVSGGVISQETKQAWGKNPRFINMKEICHP